MNRIFAYALILSFAGLTLAGAFTVHTMALHEGYSACVAAISRGLSCLEGGPLASANFHVSILKGFSEAIPSAFLLLLVLSGLFASLVRGVRPLADSAFGYVYGASDVLSHVISSRIRFVRWLSFHTHSPSFA